MLLDLRGRIANTSLPQSQCLLPLYEAISNSIHSIEDAQSANGRIRVEIERVPQQTLLNGADKVLPQIIAFTVIDNGIGFTEQNFVSFNVSDSRLKEQRGGKGLGRFSWLKAFNVVYIDSVYLESEELKTRAFEFSFVVNGTLSKNYEGVFPLQQHTRVRLSSFKENYASVAPKTVQAIAQRIFEHHLEYFILGNAPQIEVVDKYTNEVVSLQRLYTEQVTESKRQDFSIGDESFQLTHFLLKSGMGINHKLNLCASYRVVEEQKLDKLIPDLSAPIPLDEDAPRAIYSGYVSGQYLDRIVNSTRTGLACAGSGPIGLTDRSDLAERRSLLAVQRAQRRPAHMSEDEPPHSVRPGRLGDADERGLASDALDRARRRHAAGRSNQSLLAALLTERVAETGAGQRSSLRPPRGPSSVEAARSDVVRRTLESSSISMPNRSAAFRIFRRARSLAPTLWNAV